MSEGVNVDGNPYPAQEEPQGISQELTPSSEPRQSSPSRSHSRNSSLHSAKLYDRPSQLNSIQTTATHFPYPFAHLPRRSSPLSSEHSSSPLQQRPSFPFSSTLMMPAPARAQWFGYPQAPTSPASSHSESFMEWLSNAKVEELLWIPSVLEVYCTKAEMATEALQAYKTATSVILESGGFRT